MKVLQYSAPRRAEIIETAQPAIKPDQVLAQSLACNVSAGTEMAFYRGTAPQLNSRTDRFGLWEDAPDVLTYPMRSDNPGYWWMGYANVSRVVEVGRDVKDLKVGDVLFTRNPHRDYQVIGGGYLKLPGDVNPEHASFITLITICFNGLLDAKIKLMDNVVIIGLGTLGQLLVQLAKLAGARVIAVDYLDQRLRLAAKLGADRTVNPAQEGDLGKLVMAETDGGADAVLEVSGNAKALADAVRCARKNGQVTVLSFYQEAPANFLMGREFHHRRVIIRSSQIGGFDPALSFQYDASRRDAAALKLVGRLNLEALISHRVSFDKFPDALAMIDQDPAACQSVIIKY